MASRKKSVGTTAAKAAKVPKTGHVYKDASVFRRVHGVQDLEIKGVSEVWVYFEEIPQGCGAKFGDSSDLKSCRLSDWQGWLELAQRVPASKSPAAK